jgi:hypothetical protein
LRYFSRPNIPGAMTKTEFQDLLHRYTRSTRNEADAVLLLEKQYPYSQVLRSLAARLSKDHGLENHQQELQMAAVYAADRHVLKEIMIKAAAASGNGETTVAPGIIASSTSTSGTVDYADEVMHDLELLNESRHKFEMLLDRQPKREEPKPQKELRKSEPRTKTSLPAKKQATPKSRKSSSSRSKVTRRLSAAKKKTARASAVKKTLKSNRSKSSHSKKRKDGSDELISHIEKTKRRLKPSGQRQREQMQIIDQFIKAQPSISSLRDKNSAQIPTGDLVNLKQGEFGEQVISETLVTILTKQGKKDKAIEVLRKLIWKFPQKKAYFAARIEELKK